MRRMSSGISMRRREEAGDDLRDTGKETRESPEDGEKRTVLLFKGWTEACDTEEAV